MPSKDIPRKPQELVREYSSQRFSFPFDDRSDGEKDVNEKLMKEELFWTKCKRWATGGIIGFTIGFVLALTTI